MPALYSLNTANAYRPAKCNDSSRRQPTLYPIPSRRQPCRIDGFIANHPRRVYELRP